MNRCLIFVLCLLFVFFECPDFLSSESTSEFIKAITYHWFHANVFHLMANCLSAWFIYKTTQIRPIKDNVRQFILSFIIGSISYCFAGRPIIGISNILFATIGLRTPSLKNKWWKRPETIVFLIVTLLLLFVPQISSVTHIISFLCGVMVAIVQRKIKRIDYDYRHATSR